MNDQLLFPSSISNPNTMIVFYLCVRVWHYTRKTSIHLLHLGKDLLSNTQDTLAPIQCLWVDDAIRIETLNWHVYISWNNITKMEVIRCIVFLEKWISHWIFLQLRIWKSAWINGPFLKSRRLVFDCKSKLGYLWC